MSALHQARCFNHALREAVARCPGCKQFYCRECVTEHDDRLMCAKCLAAATTADGSASRPLSALVRVAQAIIGLAVLWFLFVLLGQTLLKAPSQFHEGTLWQESIWD